MHLDVYLLHIFLSKDFCTDIANKTIDGLLNELSE